MKMLIEVDSYYEQVLLSGESCTLKDLGKLINKSKSRLVRVLIFLFLDSPVDLQLIHQRHYTFQYIHIDYVSGDDNYLISSSKKTITSEPLLKEAVEVLTNRAELQQKEALQSLLEDEINSEV